MKAHEIEVTDLGDITPLAESYGLSEQEFNVVVAQWKIPKGVFDNLSGEPLREKVLKHLELHIRSKIREQAH